MADFPLPYDMVVGTYNGVDSITVQIYHGGYDASSAPAGSDPASITAAVKAYLESLTGFSTVTSTTTTLVTTTNP